MCQPEWEYFDSWFGAEGPPQPAPKKKRRPVPLVKGNNNKGIKATEESKASPEEAKAGSGPGTKAEVPQDRVSVYGELCHEYILTYLSSFQEDEAVNAPTSQKHSMSNVAPDDSVSDC